jgi:hypothetical protein
MIVAGIEYEGADIELFPDGSVHDATLLRDTTIQGVPCAGGHSIVYFPSGRLRLAWLSTATTIAGVPCAGGRIVYFQENGYVLNASLASEHLGLPPGTSVTFDETGAVLEHSETLIEDAVIDGLPCAADFPIWRYASGRLSLVVLSTAHAAGGVDYPRGAQLFFDEDGGVIASIRVDLDSGRRYKHRVFGVYEAAFE